ncbi:MAG: YegS/Rv2252/BmrU family lipid kinase [Clostridiales bacterium]|nr:YegS/Rv2252/BmrU family lipid kinase [Clostridiales bacterium]MDD7387114.1 YegS/Rv2252/BmrU family lipid kinase [Bacillota bacterium]MDY6041992.1 YegS/Rv2252/BmrU family lipid kinase [Candidatus Faecousia sp.]
MKKMLFVMNPYSGIRRANRYLADIISIFNCGGYEVTAHMTAGQGDAIRVVQEKAKDMDLVACCGGDGTFNETISGILRSGADVPVGYIPAGSTNDFAASLKLPANILQAAKDIVEGEPVAYDVGRFGQRYFSYVASFGAFTRASYATPQNIKNALGHTAYVLEGINELSQIRKTHVRMELDGQVVEDDFLFGAISNSTSVGGILTLDPKQVDMADGKLEVLLVRAPVDLLEISECIKAVQTQKYNCDMITFRSAEKIRVFADPDMPWTLDGEREDGHAEVDVENVHLAIRLMQRVKSNA